MEEVDQRLALFRHCCRDKLAAKDKHMSDNWHKSHQNLAAISPDTA